MAGPSILKLADITMFGKHRLGSVLPSTTVTRAAHSWWTVLELHALHSDLLTKRRHPYFRRESSPANQATNPSELSQINPSAISHHQPTKPPAILDPHQLLLTSEAPQFDSHKMLDHPTSLLTELREDTWVAFNGAPPQSEENDVPRWL